MKKRLKRAARSATTLLLLFTILCLGSLNALATTQQGGNRLDEYLILSSSFEGNVNDQSGNGHHGTAHGNVQYSNDGISGKALHITGSSSNAKIYVDYGNSSAIIPDFTDFSFSVFYRSLGATPDWSVILSNKNYSSGANTGFALVAKDDNGGPRLNATSRKNLLYSDQGVYDGNWHQLLASFDRDGNMVFYVDGFSVGSVDISSIASTSMNAGLPLMLGTDGSNNYLINNCMLDELRIYNKALTDEEVLEQYAIASNPGVDPVKVLARLKLEKMLVDVNGIVPSHVYPQEKIAALTNKIQGVLNQMGTLNTQQCTAKLAECEADLVQFKKGETPLASFHLISDVHVENTDGTAFAQALQGMKNINADTNIGLVIAGDNTDDGAEEEYKTFYDTLLANNPVTAEKVALVMGNHDTRDNRSSSTAWFKAPINFTEQKDYFSVIKERYLRYNAPYMPSDTSDVYHVKKMGGYTFIMLNTEMPLRGGCFMSQDQLAWLEETMAAAYAEDPAKPIFIVNHQPLAETHYSSTESESIYLEGLSREYEGLSESSVANEVTYAMQAEANAKVKAILNKYPTSVWLSGHSHNNFGRSVGVVRDHGAAVETPSLIKSSVYGGGFEVQIYRGAIVFRAINFITGEYLPEYDITIQTEENNVSAIYQEAQKILTDPTDYCSNTIGTQLHPFSEELFDISSFSAELHNLIDVYEKAGQADFYKAAQHAQINATAQKLRAAVAVVQHEREFECSTSCKKCGVTLTANTQCIGQDPCTSTSCKWCNGAVTPLGHDMKADAAIAPGCTETGLTAGAHCARCNNATTAQEVVPALGHKYDDDNDATCNTCGAQRTVSSDTGENESDQNGESNTSNNNNNNNAEAHAKKGLHGGAIAGIIAGALALVGGVVFALFRFVFKKKK